ncbi:MAG: 30S ribosomal protein S1 [Gammaproteobacteria bacterium]|nr:30S ribosomal protein S1 [Gammaproteobacteria bacterium]MCY4323576.1 30S ribosomal protein S1 [Gammaproteobacteria bacterium]
MTSRNPHSHAHLFHEPFPRGKKMSESFAELFEDSHQTVEMYPGSIISGTVVDIDNENVIVHAGLKSEGVIPKQQFLDAEGEIGVAVGDQVRVALQTVDDGWGTTRLSREKARRAETWSEIEDAFRDGSTVRGSINGKVRGGFTVNLSDIRAFLPQSLVDTSHVKDPMALEGQPLDFKVIKLDTARNNVVVSRRAVLEEENSAERQVLLDSLQEGAEMDGVVKNLTEYGAFVDLGGVDGLLHITDMAWRRIRHPEEVVTVGEQVKVKILKFDREKNRISLGMKQLGDDPWVDLKERFPAGTICDAKVTNLTDYGCFTEIMEGVEGLVHVSEMDWTNRNVHPTRVVAVGDEVKVMVLDIDVERRRISLGIKQCRPNPWEEFASKHERGDMVSGAIRAITDFGIFIGLENGIDGLVHLSDISWDESGERAVRRFKKGEEVTAQILAIDLDRERISLGIKQLTGDAFGDYVNENGRGSEVTGLVTKVDARYAEVTLADEVVATLKANEVSLDSVDNVADVLEVGQTIEVKITNIERKSRTINVSIKAREIDSTRKAVKAHQSAEEGKRQTRSLGELIRAEMGKSSAAKSNDAKEAQDS